MSHPVIIYVPGLLPKPTAAVHREALLKCLLAGLQRTDAAVAESIEATRGSFDIVSWTFDFYAEHRDIELDQAAINAVCEQPDASAADIAEATSWTRRLTRWIYQLGNLMPFLIPHLAGEHTEVHLRDLLRYENNRNGIADHIRRMLKIPLRAAASARQPILLIGHSMGSVIAYESLWELTHGRGDPVTIDHFVTMGSPLGQRFIQKRLKGYDLSGAARFPNNLRRWTNLAAIGDLTALDPTLSNDFGAMLELGLLESFDDQLLLTNYRHDGELNVHAEYGYLVNKKTAAVVADWWREHMPGLAN